LMAFFFFFFFWYWSLNLGPSPWATPPVFFMKGFFWDRVSWNIFLGWLQITILLISASWVARMTCEPLVLASTWCLNITSKSCPVPCPSEYHALSVCCSVKHTWTSFLTPSSSPTVFQPSPCLSAHCLVSTTIRSPWTPAVTPLSVPLILPSF
jgi:hypothetical protein